MSTQLDIDFPTPKAPPTAQLVIAETEINIALRFSFQVPEFEKGKLAGYHLEHRVVSNLINRDELYAFFGSAQKLVDAVDYVEGSRELVAKKHRLSPEDAKLIRYTGFSICEHLACTRVEASDPRWT
jgi:hypothetical protein